MSRVEKTNCPKHFNNNLGVAVGWRTLYKDITQAGNPITELALIPFDMNYQISTLYGPLELKIDPYVTTELIDSTYTVDTKFNKFISSSDAYKVMEYWFSNLKLIDNKKLWVTTYNYPVFYRYMCDMWGGATFHMFFDNLGQRDMLSIAGYVNDYADYHSQSIHFHKLKEGYIMKKLDQTDTDWSALTMARNVLLGYEKMVKSPKSKILE